MNKTFCYVSKNWIEKKIVWFSAYKVPPHTTPLPLPRVLKAPKKQPRSSERSRTKRSACACSCAGSSRRQSASPTRSTLLFFYEFNHIKWTNVSVWKRLDLA